MKPDSLMNLWQEQGWISDNAIEVHEVAKTDLISALAKTRDAFNRVYDAILEQWKAKNAETLPMNLGLQNFA